MSGVGGLKVQDLKIPGAKFRGEDRQPQMNSKAHCAFT